MIKKILFNPNFIYIFSFIVPFVFYSFQWSTLYPRLGMGLLLFYIFTFLICGILGLVINLIKPFKYTKIKESRTNAIIISIIFALYTFEACYSRNIPLIKLLKGTYEYTTEDSFGIPVIHTFLVSFNTFYTIYLFHQYISLKKGKLFLFFLISIVPFLLLVYRSSILNILLGTLIVYLLGKREISVMLIFKTIIGVIVVLFMFGYLGNLRSGEGDPTYIPRSSGATEEFLSSSIPKEFYWSYLYVASPVANLQNNINYVRKPEGSYSNLILNEFLPGFFTKFFIKQDQKEFNQINPFLNVGTMYVYSFSYLRWKGIIFLFLYFIAIVNLYYFLIQKSDTYKVTGLAILFNIIILANFHNTISYSAASIQLIYPVAFSMIKHQLNKKNNYNKEESIE
ncbi:O-antigen polymerase [Mucilaginibacter arboris]|uniref:Oligosaccharide repeat unit polymerase n=1 Tax=Mucilaginibacter arboris TaxID=2682090 RepID=A0A7K1SUK5_9SPHI|nr:O-antigen polymerase [Mucilaginibacter arboris]MVN21005.1 oligosaccharide repeat unit polymerase [Mucilaginibacter arboris]